MDPRLLERYNQELRFIREMGAEFAQRYPKIAGRLDLGGTECTDPYVERLLEGFAFLTARIQVKLDAEFPRFTQHLLEMVYPGYLAPTPSMAIVQFEPDLKGGVTEKGFLLPRHTEMRSIRNVKGHASCKFRTAHQVMLWPIRLVQADYLPQGEAVRYPSGGQKKVKAGLRLQLQTVTDLNFSELLLEDLSLHIKGSGELPSNVYELLMAHCVSIAVQPAGEDPAWREVLHRRNLKAQGFSEKEALLPCDHRTFHGYRLLQEYFTLPERFLFFQIAGLTKAVQRCEGSSLDIIILLDTPQDELEDLLDADNFALNCSPAINLFSRRTDRIHLTHRSTEQHVVIDRTRPRDYEVYAVNNVTGYGSGSTPEQEFRAFYSMEQGSSVQDRAYYTVHRHPTLESSTNVRSASKGDYLGSEVYVSLVDANETPYQSDLKQLGLEVVCTNRGLPRFLGSDRDGYSLGLDIGAPVNGIRNLSVFTDPRPAPQEGENAWRLISHLSLNYLSIINNGDNEGAKALRELLQLYSDTARSSVKKQIEGVISVSSEQVVRRMPVNGPMAFGRGTEIRLVFDELEFQGVGVFLLGAVLDRFFSKYSSINSFTQTVVSTRERGEIMQWPVRTGTRTLI